MCTLKATGGPSSGLPIHIERQDYGRDAPVPPTPSLKHSCGSGILMAEGRLGWLSA